MTLRLLLVLVLLLGPASSWIERAAHAQPARPGQDAAAPQGGLAKPVHELEITVATRTRLKGQLLHKGVGVQFESMKDGQTFQLRIATSQGDELLSARSSAGGVRTSVLNGRATGSLAKADVAKLQDRVRTIRRPSGGTAAQPYSTVVGDLVAATRVTGDASAVGELRQRPEYALLPELSRQLAKAGMTGHKYPPSFALHLYAMAAAESVGVPAPEPQVVFRQKLPSTLRPNVTGSLYEQLGLTSRFGFCWTPGTPNLDKLPPCPRDSQDCGDNAATTDGCFGRCGPGCTCWESICGDCCFNAKCAVHDAIRRSCSWNPLTWGSCLAVVHPAWLIPAGCS